MTSTRWRESSVSVLQDNMGVENYGAYKQNQTQANIARSNARIAAAQGQAAKGKAYGQAAKIERENEVAGRNAAENLMRVREAQTKAEGAVVATHGASGFTSEGSGSTEQVSVLERFEQTAQDMAYSRSLQDVGARFSATMSRKAGDIAEMQGQADSAYQNAQAAVYDDMAKNAKHAMVTSIIGQVGGAIVGGIFGGAAGAQLGMKVGGGIASQSNRGLVGSYESQNGGDEYQEKVSAAWIGEQMSNWLK